jgi:hypothetical protein
MQLEKIRMKTKNFSCLVKPKKRLRKLKEAKEVISRTEAQKLRDVDFINEGIDILHRLATAKISEIKEERRILQKLRKQSWFREWF